MAVENVVQIVIHALDFGLPHSLRGYADRRIRTVLTCYSEHIQQVVIRLSQDNGGRSADYKHCHLQVKLGDLPDVVVDDVQTDLRVAIGRATHRAGRTIKRRLVRQRDEARKLRQYA